MKLITTLIVLVLFASTSFAATPFTKLGFGGYSQAGGASTTCTVFASDIYLPVDPRGGFVQAIKPDSNLSRSYTLTKGARYVNYSTQYPLTTGRPLNPAQFSFTCVLTGTSTLAPVMVFLNGIKTYFLTLSSGLFGGGW